MWCAARPYKQHFRTGCKGMTCGARLTKLGQQRCNGAAGDKFQEDVEVLIVPVSALPHRHRASEGLLSGIEWQKQGNCIG